MMTGLQLAILSGAMLAGGISLLVLRLAPAPTHLGDAIARLRPLTVQITTTGPTHRPDTETRVGSWAQKHLPAGVWGTPPEHDLAILQRTRTSFYGSKIIAATIGLIIGPLLTLAAMALGVGVPFAIPVIGSIGLGAVMWLMPGAEVKDKARLARAEFSYALGAFVEMVALERLSGSGVPQALQRAADIGDSWAFQRISATLKRTEYTGHNPWDALEDLGNELNLTDLADLADIMRLAGADGTQIYTSLRARAATMRNALLTNHIAAANRTGERIAIPVGLLVIVLAITLITPAFLRMIT
ncbi:type II secretion system F family protein [Tessaracoccus antarcticus]|uniref:Type II secretion system protein GspF domain-containing protein n=1 Tax=Tessaracoccus antarcticus TaxID=2479848 RepID=A0A3M0G100_9ACTN|nr:type II secretion system F family protein [Tessaracoccus antarcticus]RMB57867.1 hypothetical protein EAX62_15560 [Tessaracoccus antarcticus]